MSTRASEISFVRQEMRKADAKIKLGPPAHASLGETANRESRDRHPIDNFMLYILLTLETIS
jgi:hypothetical protein